MDTGSTDREAARLVLEWHRAMGIDCIVSDVATDWLSAGDRPPGHGLSLDGKSHAPPQAAGRPPASAPGRGLAPPGSAAPPAARAPSAARPAPQQASASVTSAPRTFPTSAPDAAQAWARENASTAASLGALAEALAAFDGCALKATAKNLCFYRGAPASRLMLIGEAPGREEDLEGRPFVGRAGRLLDKMLAAAGFGEADAHITNIVYWRPPGNRTPTPQEALVCRPFLERQIELVAPDIVLALGGAAAKHLLGVEDGIMRLRGKWREVELGGAKRRLMATLHPAYLLRTPVQKRLAWRDLLAVAEALEAGALHAPASIAVDD